jgi:hypothetical protein
VTEFISKWKWLILALAGILLVICLILLAGLGWTAFRPQEETPAPTVQPDAFLYCGARLTSLCVVSFGRDAFGDTVINLYVPLRTYPNFYLKVIRASGESRYACEINKAVKTSAYCSGDALNLGEGFELQLLAEMDDRLLAQGTFTLTAFLVGTPGIGGAVSEPRSSEPTVTIEVVETPTSSVFEINPSTATVTATATRTPASSSYPNYP